MSWLVPLSDTSVEEDAPPGRRQRNKNRTREDLAAAAIHLFATRGYDNVTIEEVAECADVSPRTFFRYFSSKEGILFPSDYPTEPLMAALSRQPETSNDLQAIRDAYLELLPRDQDGLRRILQLKMAIRSAPALEGRDLAQQDLFRNHLAVAIARRNSLDEPDELVLLIATLAQAVLRLAFDEWTESDGTDDLEANLRYHFDLADRIFTPPRSTQQWRQLARKSTGPNG